MDPESDHEFRDDESVSEQEEIEETKPKSALKKGRDVLPPVERPELPYVLKREKENFGAFN
jgi:translation initiation factor 2 subunit 3